jgi:hypothetical protein
MGIAYDKAISANTANALTGEQRARYMLHAVELDEKAIIRNMDILEEETQMRLQNLSNERVTESIGQRKSKTAAEFVIDRFGFTAPQR